MSTVAPPNGRVNSQLEAVATSLRQLYPQISQGKFNVWEAIQIAVMCSVFPGLWYLRRRIEIKSTWWSSSESSISDGMVNGSARAGRKNVDINGTSLVSSICDSVLTLSS